MRSPVAVTVTVCAALAVAAAACGLELAGTAQDLAEGGAPSGSSDASLDSTSNGDAGGVVDGSGVTTDGGGSGDAGDDANGSPDGDAATMGCTGVLCNGACIDASTCLGCAAGHALCVATNTCGDCSSCTDDAGTERPIECYGCDSTRSNPIGTCEPNDASVFCLSETYPPPKDYHCGCPNFDVSLCPGSTQVCIDIAVGAPVCVTCGEQGALTDTATCNDGKKCHANDNPPRCK